jgi:hypothetical protein
LIGIPKNGVGRYEGTFGKCVRTYMEMKEYCGEVEGERESISCFFLKGNLSRKDLK